VDDFKELQKAALWEEDKASGSIPDWLGLVSDLPPLLIEYKYHTFMCDIAQVLAYASFHHQKKEHPIADLSKSITSQAPLHLGIYLHCVISKNRIAHAFALVAPPTFPALSMSMSSALHKKHGVDVLCFAALMK